MHHKGCKALGWQRLARLPTTLNPEGTDTDRSPTTGPWTQPSLRAGKTTPEER